ncbi:hypothetical protein [Occultella gossypii]|uniref:Uncharacterized protein n=1 Tax=Occultella gossypii TaxID=2800820 RepID=A0ABS7S897_9MICO|nr:hypothetical protein [Occultella gossypii]MBZ2196574.1 hypothetical protein [Occultella gossypii]
MAERIDVIAHGLRQLGHPETAVVFTRLAEQVRNTPSRAQRKVVKRELARLLQAGIGQISDQCPGSPQDSREYRDAVVWLQTYARS